MNSADEESVDSDLGEVTPAFRATIMAALPRVSPEDDDIMVLIEKI
eukprot:CAMPEP_0171350262 /NCGR_PEP_ID=MMETSP0878-20121228/36043_1 /TAXON_ID=67004 /ORGANISM="Thalassiosira weissflogii, Strain CCMP1336" /LENGTH=45 /DNA_ID= /DNA_START= /DNA_END= /DNA_ORIENTATION=